MAESPFFLRIEIPLSAHIGSVPLDPFAGSSCALLGKGRKPVRLQPVRRGCSFLTFSFVGCLSEVSSAMLFSPMLLFLLSVLLFEWFFHGVSFFWLRRALLLFGLGSELIINYGRIELDFKLRFELCF